MASIPVIINPEILIWARKSIGYSIGDIKEFKATFAKYIEQYESGKPVPIAQLKEIAKKYKRDLSVFFLDKPPIEKGMPPEYRSIPIDDPVTFTKDTILAVRSVRQMQRDAIDISDELRIKLNPKIGFEVGLSDSVVDLAIEVRKHLNVSLEEQFQTTDRYDALNLWKNAIEKKGVLVTSSNYPRGEAKGFAIYDDQVPAISYSTDDFVNSRIFTILHEYAHLMLKEDGICDLRSLHNSKLPSAKKRIEVFCNKFAGEILVPSESIKHTTVFRNGRKIDEEDIESLSKRYSVSREVIARRLLDLNRIDEELYTAVRLEGSKQTKSKSSGGPNQWVKCVSRNGSVFTNLVLEAISQGAITSVKAAKYLNVKAKYLGEVENQVWNNKADIVHELWKTVYVA